MVVFPNCKINLGLNVLAKRADGYHDLESIFIPVNWCDALEIIENSNSERPFEYSQSGRGIEGKPEENLIFKAWEKLNALHKIPPIKVHLHKNIPMGAGLGGGSSDAVFFLKACKQLFALDLSFATLLDLCSQLGSDCAFFIENKPAIAGGRGEILRNVSLNLRNFYVLVIYPEIHCSTKTAFEKITPGIPENRLEDLAKLEVSRWKNLIKNDFETPMMRHFPLIEELKQNLYKSSAVYASMSGSGSAVYGLFETEPTLETAQNYSYYLQKPKL